MVLKMKMEKILIAPCGMNCALCMSYLAMKNDLKKQGVMTGYCAGCRPRGKNCAFMKKSCELLAKGLVKYCYECAEFPCQRLKNLDKRYRTNYHMSMIENLDYIKEHGMTKFLKQQLEKWRCLKCGGVITCHGGLCYSCEVEKLKSRGKGRYKWEGE
jgi:hypothetical protein